MADFITLSCPSCGGKLQITNDIEQFACANCGNEHLIKRSGGVVTITPLIDGLKQVQRGTDKTAAELALVRLREEYSALQKQIHHIVFSSNSNLRILVPLLQKIGKVSFIESLFLTTDSLSPRIESLSEDELGTAIQILERGIRILNQRTIDQLTTIKKLKSQLREVGSRLDEKQRIADM